MSTSKTENEKGNWLDFETIKANANVTAVLTYYGLIGPLGAKLQFDDI